MTLFENETKLFDAMQQELYSAVIGDILDDLGFTSQMMKPEITPIPIWDEAVVCGRAMTVLSADIYEKPEKPYSLALEALDSLKPNDLYVVTTNSSRRYACWGELMSTAARARGARGTIIDGFTRDTKGIIAMRYPVFACGCWSCDTRGRGEVISYNVTIECGGVKVEPGQILFGDRDGVVVIPKEAEKETITKSFERARGEKIVKKALEMGMTAREAFAKYGIL